MGGVSGRKPAGSQVTRYSLGYRFRTHGLHPWLLIFKPFRLRGLTTMRRYNETEGCVIQFTTDQGDNSYISTHVNRPASLKGLNCNNHWRSLWLLSITNRNPEGVELWDLPEILRCAQDDVSF